MAEVSGRHLNTAFTFPFHNGASQFTGNYYVPCSYSETPLQGEVKELRCDWKMGVCDHDDIFT